MQLLPSNLDKEIIDKIIGLVSDYFNRSKTKSTVINYKSDEELKNIFGFEISTENENKEWLTGFIENFLHYTVQSAHPNFSNQLFTGINDISLLGEVLAAATNTTMAVYEASPVAYNFERSLVAEILTRIGFSSKPNHGDGIMTPGGSYSNMKALLAARNWLYPETKQKGSKQNFVIFASEFSHYSIDKSANLLGIGEENVRYVAGLPNGTIDVLDFEKQVVKEKSIGNIPLFVMLTSGTTEYGTFDDIEATVKIAKQHNIWVHADGAWGGAVAFSKTKRDKLKGIELADSFSWDAHKVLGIPLYASFFLINKPVGSMEQIFGTGNGDYLFHGDSMDLGKKSLQCARRNDALKVWLLFKFFGTEAIENALDNLFDLSAQLAKGIDQSKDFEMVMKPEFLNVCFKVRNPTKLSNAQFHKIIRENLKYEGNYFFNYTVRNENEAFFRLITNLQTTKESFEKLKLRILTEVDKLKSKQ